jgi:hypothetical protein
LIPLERPDSDSEGSESESGFYTPEEDSVLVTECGQLSLIMSDTVASLLKLSMVVQKSSRQAKFARSSRDKQYDSQFDILHVKESFPWAANNDTLVEKLGKANAQRRQWISYRRRHREKLSLETDSTSGHMSDLQSQAPTGFYSQGEQDTNAASSVSFSSRGPQGSVTADHSTVATTFDEEPQVTRPERTVEEEASETSFSASSVTGENKGRILVPQPPPESADGKLFECPFCCTVLCVESRQSWM